MDIVIKLIGEFLFIYTFLLGLRKDNSIKEDIEYKFLALVFLIISLSI